MPEIQLKNRFASDVTMISNIFIDEYMVDANGEYVKIYLCILRLSAEAGSSWTLNTIADRMECTTRDVIRALHYWTKKGLMECEYNQESQLTSLTLLEPSEVHTSGSMRLSDSGNVHFSKPGNISVADSEGMASSDSGQAVNNKDGDSCHTEETEPVQERLETHLSPERIQMLKKDSSVGMILYVAEQYMGRPLSAAEMETLLFFYDEMKFSADLVEYLVEYCVSKDKRNFSYLKRVGFSWAEEGIHTVAEAREASYSQKKYFAILNAYGISGRNPVEAELGFMKTWIRDYGLSMEMILLAVNRTMGTIHAPRFEYTDSILKSWKEKKLVSPEDVERQDELHSLEMEKAYSSPKITAYRNTGDLEKKSPRHRGKNGTGFNNFEGRAYDYDALERSLQEVK